MIVGGSAGDPDLAAFLAPAHIGRCFIVGGEGVAPHLVYFTEMEREEAASTGLPLLDPGRLGLSELRSSSTSAGSLASATWLRALDILGLKAGRLAIAGRLPADELIEALPSLSESGWSPVPGGSVLRMVRKQKDEWELQRIREAAEGVCEAFRHVARTLRDAEVVGGALHLGGRALTAGILRRGVSVVLAELGLGQPAGNIVAAGHDSAIPHSQGASERQLRPGVSLVVDLYPKGELFADCSRTFCLPPAPDALVEAHAEVVLALERAEAAARVGRSGRSVQEVVCESFERAGFATPRTRPGLTTGYVHSVGHGVGYELHELPSFRGDGGEGQIARGDVLTLEPGLYDPQEGWGVRVENLYHVGSSLENLTPLPVALDPRQWDGLE